MELVLSGKIPMTPSESDKKGIWRHGKLNHYACLIYIYIYLYIFILVLCSMHYAVSHIIVYRYSPLWLVIVYTH